MATNEERINAAIVQLEGDTETLHDFMHNPNPARVQTESGEIPSIPTLIAELSAQVVEVTTEAVTAASSAAASASTAASKADNADTRAADAAASALTAENSASEAADQVAAAVAASQNSANSAAESLTQAQAAAGSAQGAASSASAAQSAVQPIAEAVGNLVGVKAEEPTARNDGSALEIGDSYVNSAELIEYIFNGEEWVKSTAGLEADLAANEGSTKIGVSLYSGFVGKLQDAITWLYNGVQELLKLNKHITPEQFGFKAGDTLEVRTACLQAAFNEANTSKRQIVLSGYYFVSTILLEDHTEYGISGTGAIIGMDTAPHAAVLEMKNCTGLKSSGSIFISANNNTNYTAAIKVWGSGSVPSLRTCSLLSLNFNAGNANVGWQFGDLSAPDNLLSEIVISDGYTSGTPQPVIVIGSQAVIEFNGYQLVAAAGGPFTASLHVVAWVYGGRLVINGGECMIPGNTSGYCFAISPIDSPGFDNLYGTIDVDGASVESASLLGIAYNPNGVAGLLLGSGGIRLNTCAGFHGFPGASFQSAADFTGYIIVTPTSYFRAPVPRNIATAVMFGTGAHVSLSELAFDSNFKPGLSAISGGIAHFEDQQIFEACSLSGQSMPVSVSTVLKFATVPVRDNNTRFAPAYNASTGAFTTPPGGLKSARLFIMCDVLAGRPNSSFNVLINGAIAAGAFSAPSQYISESIELGDLAAGDTVSIRFANLDTAFSFGSVNTDRMVIRARC